MKNPKTLDCNGQFLYCAVCSCYGCLLCWVGSHLHTVCATNWCLILVMFRILGYKCQYMYYSCVVCFYWFYTRGIFPMYLGIFLFSLFSWFSLYQLHSHMVSCAQYMVRIAWITVIISNFLYIFFIYGVKCLACFPYVF